MERKSVKIGKTVYVVRVGEDLKRIEVEETVYPLFGYGNNYGTRYKIDLDYSKGWALAEISCWNATWATRGHGMTDYWTEATGYIRKSVAKKIMEQVETMLENAENGTPDVKEIFDAIKQHVCDACDSYL